MESYRRCGSVRGPYVFLVQIGADGVAFLDRERAAEDHELSDTSPEGPTSAEGERWRRRRETKIVGVGGKEQIPIHPGVPPARSRSDGVKMILVDSERRQSHLMPIRTAKVVFNV